MFYKKPLFTTALIWLPLAIVFSASIAFAYTAVQQNYRMSLNDPQVQVTADAVQMVKNGRDVNALVPTERIDMATSLLPFIIFYDQSGKMLTGSGLLNGTVPTPPPGVFDYTKTHGEDRLTWQPQNNVRIAAVVRKTSNGYVLAGRSMKEIESRINNLTNMALIAWLAGLVVSLLATLGLAAMYKKKKA